MSEFLKGIARDWQEEMAGLDEEGRAAMRASARRALRAGNRQVRADEEERAERQEFVAGLRQLAERYMNAAEATKDEREVEMAEALDRAAADVESGF